MPRFFVVTTNRYLQFVFDVAASAFLTFVLSTMVWGLIAGGGQGAAFAAMWVPGILALVLVTTIIPFAVLPIWGVAADRWGFVLGPIILAAATYAVSSLAVRQKEDAIAVLTNFATEP